MTLRGCGTALVTPFRSDSSLDEETLTGLVEWQIESGIDFLVACGTTAETPTLTHEEWLRVIHIVTESAAGRVPILAGCTHNSPVEAVARAGEAAGEAAMGGFRADQRLGNDADHTSPRLQATVRNHTHEADIAASYNVSKSNKDTTRANGFAE